MERAAAVVLGGIGLVLLVLAALTVVGPDPDPEGGGVDLAVFATTAPVAGVAADTGVAGGTGVTGVTVLGTTARLPTTTTSASTAPSTAAPSTTAPPPSSTAPAPPAPAPLPAELVEAVREVTEGGVRFAVGRAELDAPAAARLSALAAQLRARPDVVLVVVGHTDSTGPEEINRPLSRLRAQAVVDFLVHQGVAPAQLRTEGLGPDRPVADNASVEGRRANRRSEVSVEADR